LLVKKGRGLFKFMTKQMTILISACLLGKPVRYNGTDLSLKDHPLIKKWDDSKLLIPLCPEVAGGMSVPRSPAEISLGNGYSVLSLKSKVISKDQCDVSKYFIAGAQKALALAKKNNCVAAILTERSPSCGSQQIYDGSFSNTRIAGMGVTTALLEKNGILVFNQYQLEDLERYCNDSHHTLPPKEGQ